MTVSVCGSWGRGGSESESESAAGSVLGLWCGEFGGLKGRLMEVGYIERGILGLTVRILCETACDVMCVIHDLSMKCLVKVQGKCCTR